MPYFGDTDSGPVGPAPMDFGAPSLSDVRSAAQYVTPTDSGNPLVNAAGMALQAPGDFLDTVASSTLGKFPGGPQRGQVAGAINSAVGMVSDPLLTAIGMPGLNDFYNQHRAGIEAMSGVGGMVAASVLTDGLFAEGGAAMGALAKLPYVRRVATLDQQYRNAMDVVKGVDLSLAQSGALSFEQFAGQASVDGLIYSPRLGGFITHTYEIARDKAVFQAKGLGALVGARNAALTEGVAYSALNSNGFLYSDDAAQNTMWQALGVAGGAAVDWLHAGYQIRKYTNSDQVRRAFASALDPGGDEESRLLWANRNVKPLDSSEGFLGGSYTDQITNLKISAANRRELPIDQSTVQDPRMLLANRDRLATQDDQLASDTLNKVTTKGISSDGTTRFANDDQLGYASHVQMGLHRDAAMTYGVEQIGAVPDGVDVLQLHQNHMTRLQERINQTEQLLSDPTTHPLAATKLQSIRNRLTFESQLTPSVLIDGEKMPITAASGILGFNEPKIFFNKDINLLGPGHDTTGIFEAQTGQPAPVSLGTDFSIHIPSGRNLVDADHFDVLRLYRLGDSMADHVAKWTGPITLPKDPNFLHLDLAEQILQRNPNANIVWPAGMTRDSAQVESFAQKAEAMQTWNQQLAMNTKTQGDPEALMNKLRVRLNIPRLTAYEMGTLETTAHPVETLMRGAGQMSPDEIRAMPLQDLKEGVAQTKRISDLSPVTANDVSSLIGNSFKYMMDESGNPVKPVLMYSRPFRPIEWSLDDVADRLGARKMLSVQIMTDKDAGPLTQALTSAAMKDPNFIAASSPHELMDTQTQGSVTGKPSQSMIGSFLNDISTTDTLARDNTTILSAAKLRDNVERVSRNAMKVIVDGTFGDSLNQLKNPRNASGKLLLDQFHSNSGGWDLAPKEINRGNGFSAFQLTDTQENHDLWKLHFGADLPKGQTLVNLDGKEIVLDQLSLDIQKRYNVATNALLAEKNTILRANGLPEIKSKDWYVPPPNTTNKYIGFTMGPDGKAVPHMGIVAATPSQYAQKEQLLRPYLDKLGPGYVLRTQQDIANFANIYDKAQMDFIDPATTAAQPNRPGLGKLRGPEIDLNAFENSMQYLRNGFLDHTNDVMGTLLREQINSGLARSAASDVRGLNGAGGKTGAQRFNNVYDLYLQALTGKSKLNSPGSFFGSGFNYVEGKINQVLTGADASIRPGLSQANSKFNQAWAMTNDWINRANPWSNTPAAKDDFTALSQALGEHMPFSDTADMLEAQGLATKPWTAQGISKTMNQFSSATLLRVMEFAQPIMNMAGIINAMPSVIRNAMPQAGESAEDHAARIGHVASIFNLPNGVSMGILDMPKLIAQGLKAAWEPNQDAAWAYRVERGYVGQEAAMFHRQMGSINSRSTWQNAFMGDPTQQAPATLKAALTNPIQAMKSKGVLGLLSYVSDSSEDLSRSWAHMTGVKLGQFLGITDQDSLESFAHDIANKTIANYSPHNRPAVFQGAIGANLGLFQSFMQEYYSRIFRYVETKNGSALGLQLGMQGGLFGINSLPGWSEYNKLMSAVGNQGNDPQSGIQQKFGINPGDLLGNGVLSNIPTLFGAPGVNLYSRGDTAINLPGTVIPPAWSILGKISNGFVQGIQAFAEAHGALTHTELAEIVSNMIPNRPIAGMIQQFAGHGNEIDKNGQLVSDTQNAMEATYRILGVRSERQSDEINAFYANKNAMAHKASADDVLRLATRAALRQGATDALPAIFQKYLENGGDPHYFKRWVQTQYQAATTTRGANQLSDALKNPAKMGQVVRLLDAGVSIQADTETPDPATMYGGVDQGDELTQGTAAPGDYSGQATVP